MFVLLNIILMKQDMKQIHLFQKLLKVFFYFYFFSLKNFKVCLGVLGIRAALMVLEGLPSRAHQVFSLLAEEQLQSNTGFSFKILLRKWLVFFLFFFACILLNCYCSREKFILTNEHHLKGYLNEFKEHKLVKIINNRREGTELYSICMPSAFISKILSEIENGALGQ